MFFSRSIQLFYLPGLSVEQFISNKANSYNMASLMVLRPSEIHFLLFGIRTSIHFVY